MRNVYSRHPKSNLLPMRRTNQVGQYHHLIQQCQRRVIITATHQGTETISMQFIMYKYQVDLLVVKLMRKVKAQMFQRLISILTNKMNNRVSQDVQHLIATWIVNVVQEHQVDKDNNLIMETQTVFHHSLTSEQKEITIYNLKG